MSQPGPKLSRAVKCDVTEKKQIKKQEVATYVIVTLDKGLWLYKNVQGLMTR